jgi:pilus assembly protein CpaB
MYRRRLFLIGAFSLGLGALVSYMIYQLFQKQVRTERAPGVDVVVAANNIPPGQRISDLDLTIVKYPADLVPPNVVHSKGKIVGEETAFPIEKGEFMTPFKLVHGDGLSSLIPPGMRAAPVRVNDPASGGSAIEPRSHVDVVVTAPTERGVMQSMTVLQDIRVLAVDGRVDQNSTATKAAATPSTITLLVSPEDAERLALASQAGRIQLLLRNPIDTVENKVPVATDLSGVTGTSQKQVKARVVRTQIPTAPEHVIQVCRGSQCENVRMPQ